MPFRVTAHPFPGEGEPTVRDHDTIGDAVDHLADLAVDVEGGVTLRIELEETPR